MGASAALIEGADCVCLTVEEQDRIRRAVALYEEQIAEDRRRQQEAAARAWREQLATKPLTETGTLNDPAALRKDKPPRDADFGSASCGASSLQVFDGEDLMEGDRRALQAEQVASARLRLRLRLCLGLGLHLRVLS